MRLIRHPLVNRDVIELVDHIVEATGGDTAAALRRLDEIDDLILNILSNPLSGMRLSDPLQGWLVRHGGQGHHITIVFRAYPERDALYIALVAFGRQDWMTKTAMRKLIAD